MLASSPSLFCSPHCRCVPFNSLPLRLIHLDATPRLCLSMLCSALPMLYITTPLQFFSTQNYAVAYLCNSQLFCAIAHHRHSMPPQFNAILCRCNSIHFVADAKPIDAMPCLSNSYYAYPLRLFCVSVQLVLCSATASLVVLLLRYAYASLNVTNPHHAYAFQRLTKP